MLFLHRAISIKLVRTVKDLHLLYTSPCIKDVLLIYPIRCTTITLNFYCFRVCTETHCQLKISLFQMNETHIFSNGTDF